MKLEELYAKLQLTIYLMVKGSMFFSKTGSTPMLFDITTFFLYCESSDQSNNIGK